MARHREPQVAVQLLASIPQGMYGKVFQPVRDPKYWRLSQRLPTIFGWVQATAFLRSLSSGLSSQDGDYHWRIFPATFS